MGRSDNSRPKTNKDDRKNVKEIDKLGKQRKRNHSAADLDETSNNRSAASVAKGESPLGIPNKQTRSSKLDRANESQSNVRRVLIKNNPKTVRGKNNNASPIKAKKTANKLQNVEQRTNVFQNDTEEELLDYKDVEDNVCEKVTEPIPPLGGDGIEVTVEQPANFDSDDQEEDGNGSSGDEDELQDNKSVSIMSSESNVVTFKPTLKQAMEPAGLNLDAIRKDPTFKDYVLQIVNETWSSEKAELEEKLRKAKEGNDSGAKQSKWNNQFSCFKDKTIKSPSDTTIYAPGLNKQVSNRVENAFNEKDVFNQISSFVENIRLEEDVRRRNSPVADSQPLAVDDQPGTSRSSGKEKEKERRNEEEDYAR